MGKRGKDVSKGGGEVGKKLLVNCWEQDEGKTHQRGDLTLGKKGFEQDLITSGYAAITAGGGGGPGKQRR